MSTIEPRSTKFAIKLDRVWHIARFVAATLVSTTLVTLFAQYHWLADLLANLRVQQCLVLLAVLLTCLVFRKWAWFALTLACLAIHLPSFKPALPDGSTRRPASGLMKITTANVLTQNQRHQDILTDVLSRDPDVFVILELSHSLAEALESQVRSTYPHSIVRPMDSGNFGIGLYSRHPLVDADVFALNTEIESIAATIQINGNPCHVIATHPLPPIGARGYRLRNEHLQQLAAKIRNAIENSPETPVVLLGDLNLTPWSPHFAMFESDSGLRRAFDRPSVTPTWYRYPLFPFGLMLDHAMISDNLSCTSHAVGPEIGSDHRSVTVEIAMVDQS